MDIFTEELLLKTELFTIDDQFEAKELLKTEGTEQFVPVQLPKHSQVPLREHIPLPEQFMAAIHEILHAPAG